MNRDVVGEIGIDRPFHCPRNAGAMLGLAQRRLVGGFDMNPISTSTLGISAAFKHDEARVARRVLQQRHVGVERADVPMLQNPSGMPASRC